MAIRNSLSPNVVVPLASAMASDRPSGDGIAPKISVLLERSRTDDLPSIVTFSSALSPS